MTAESNVGVTLESICVPSDDIVAREIEGDIVIVPLVAGIGDMDDELFTLNETGQAIWQRLDGEKSLGEVATSLAEEFEAPLEKLQADVLGFASEMTRQRILAARAGRA